MIVIGILSLLFLTGLAFALWDVDRDPDGAIRRKQQEALKRHHKQMERAKKQAEAYWRERGKVIRPRGEA